MAIIVILCGAPHLYKKDMNNSGLYHSILRKIRENEIIDGGIRIYEKNNDCSGEQFDGKNYSKLWTYESVQKQEHEGSAIQGRA